MRGVKRATVRGRKGRRTSRTGRLRRGEHPPNNAHLRGQGAAEPTGKWTMREEESSVIDDREKTAGHLS